MKYSRFIVATTLTGLVFAGTGCNQPNNAQPAASAPAAQTQTDSAPAATAEAKITEEDVVAAQKVWGEGIVDISRIHTEGGDYKERASKHVRELYAYDLPGPVMFKPTLASEDQFRETFDEGLSYFIGTPDTEDKGFAIKGWTNVRWESNGIQTDGKTATSMGNYFFTGPDGKEVKVEYSFGYLLDDKGDLRINLHHSSLPYSPAK